MRNKPLDTDPEMRVLDNGEEAGYVLLSEGGPGGEVIVLSHHLNTYMYM